MVEGLLEAIEGLVLGIGPVGIFLAMFIETVFPPIPSEIIMPLGGYVAFVTNQGFLGLFTMILAGTLGSTLGAIVIYAIALKGGRYFIFRYGRWVGINKKKIWTAEKWFKKYGDYAVFFGRMAPGVRELVSVPAGFAKMNFTRFALLTFAGSFIWSAFLGSVGFFFADTWRSFEFDSLFGIAALMILLSIATYLIFKYWVSHRNNKIRKRRRR